MNMNLKQARTYLIMEPSSWATNIIGTAISGILILLWTDLRKKNGMEDRLDKKLSEKIAIDMKEITTNVHIEIQAVVKGFGAGIKEIDAKIEDKYLKIEERYMPNKVHDAKCEGVTMTLHDLKRDTSKAHERIDNIK